MPQPVGWPAGWHELEEEEVKLGVVLNPLVPNTDNSFSVCSLPQLGQDSSISAVVQRTSLSNFSPHCRQRYS
jgi:hypothetical protein